MACETLEKASSLFEVEVKCVQRNLSYPSPSDLDKQMRLHENSPHSTPGMPCVHVMDGRSQEGFHAYFWENQGCLWVSHEQS
jgi:hypothetical protein